MKIDDLKEISVPESHEYFLKLIWQRHLLNFFWEVKQLNSSDPNYFKTLEEILTDPDRTIPDWDSSLDEETKKQLKHILTLVRDNK